MTRPRLLLACIAALAAVHLLSAQEAETPPVPAPTPGVEVPETGPIAQITMDDGAGLTLKLRGRHSQRVLLRAGQRATVLLRYDQADARLALNVSAMDGGTVSFPAERNFVGPDGMVVLQFSDARDPGLYRVVVNCGATVSTLQFWVPNPDDPGPDASIAVPTASSSPVQAPSN